MWASLLNRRTQHWVAWLAECRHPCCCNCAPAGLSVRELDSRALREIFDVLQRHYPERLARLFFLNAPFVFWGVWQVCLGGPRGQQAGRGFGPETSFSQH